jgi:tetratricopeptide (TPR) repeat protein
MSAPSSRLGPYTLIRQLGVGGMGEVHLARDSRLGREVAIKILPDGLAADPDRRSRLLREARAAAALNHPNIATIFDVGEAEGRDYVAFERIEGQTLADVLAVRELSIDEVLAIALPLADALAYAHERGVIHRDVKAANVMLTARGAPKLLDFGLAKFEEGAGLGESAELTVSGAIVGTPGAMSPEQAQGKPVDARSDVFSFGSLLYELLARRPAFTGETVLEIVAAVLRDQPPPLSEVRPEVPPALAAVVEKALCKDPEERHASMRDLRAELERAAGRRAGDGSSSRGPAPAVRVLAVLALGLLAWAVWRGFATNGPASSRESFDGIPFGVIGFEGVGDEAAQLVRLLVPLVTTDLAEGSGLAVLSHARIREAERQVLGAGSSFDPASAREVARAAGAEVMLVGDVTQGRSGLQVLGEIVDVGSGRSLGAARAASDAPDDLFGVAATLCNEVRQQLGLGGAADRSPALDPAAFLTSSTAAWNRFVAGRLALHESDYYDAIQHFEGALREDETFALAAFYLAISVDWSGAPDRDEQAALERGRPYLDRLPPRWRATYEALLAMSVNDFDRSYELLDRLVAQPDVLPDTLNLLGEVLEHSPAHWDPGRARQVFERALAIDPTFDVVVFHLADSLLLEGDDATLERLIASLRARDPASARALSSEAMGLIWHRRWAEAAPLAAEIDRRDLFMDWWFVGRVAEFQGRLDEALAAFSLGVTDEENFRRAWALQARAHAQLRAGRLSESLTDLDAAIAPMETEDFVDVLRAATIFLDDRARLLELTGDVDAALASARRAVELVPHEASGYFWLVHLLLRHGEPREVERAVQAFEDVRGRTRNVTFPAFADLIEAERALAAGDTARAHAALAAAQARTRAMRDVPLEHWLAARLAEAEGDPRRAALEYAGVQPTYCWYVISHELLSIEAEVRRQCLLQDLGDPAFDRGVLEERFEAWRTTGLPLVEDLRQRLAR